MKLPYVALAMAVAAQLAAAAAPTLPETAVERYARMIWYPIERKPAVAKTYKQLEARLSAEDWNGAAAAARRLTPLIPSKRERYEAERPLEWRVAIGELHLYDLEPEKAAGEFQAVLAAVPAPKDGHGRSSARQTAAYALARAKAELGDFAAALKWLERAPDEYWSGCGNCMDGEAEWGHPIRTVWKVALQPDEMAVPALEAITRGEFTPIKARLSPAKTSAANQLAHARAEAGLILGEIQLRRGWKAEARAAFHLAADSNQEIARIARTYLKRRLGDSRTASASK
jgi:hypothetical protein